jgi:hypothetical protein
LYCCGCVLVPSQLMCACSVTGARTR